MIPSAEYFHHYAPFGMSDLNKKNLLGSVINVTAVLGFGSAHAAQSQVFVEECTHATTRVDGVTHCEVWLFMWMFEQEGSLKTFDKHLLVCFEQQSSLSGSAKTLTFRKRPKTSLNALLEFQRSELLHCAL